MGGFEGGSTIAGRGGRRSAPGARALALALCVAAAAPTCAAVERQVRVGRAHDVESGRFVYSEVHREVLEEDRVTSTEIVYVDAENRVVARKEIDFSRDPLLPDYTFQNTQTGYLESASRAGTSLLVRFRAAAGEREERAVLKPSLDATSGAGLERIIDRYWDTLVGGVILEASFLIPSRLDFMRFRIRADPERSTADAVAFLVEPDSAFLRLLVPAVELDYDRATHAIRFYIGTSVLRDPDGGGRRVRVDYAESTEDSDAARAAPPGTRGPGAPEPPN